MSLFQSNLRKQIRKLPKILKSVKSIHHHSLLFIRAPDPDPVDLHHLLHAGRPEDAHARLLRGPPLHGRVPGPLEGPLHRDQAGQPRLGPSHRRGSMLLCFF